MAGIKLSGLIDAIATLSVTLTNGSTLKICKDSTIPDSATRLGSILFPNPAGFISDFVVEPVTYGTGGVERLDVTYTLSYVFCSIPVGAGRGIGENYTVLVDDTVLILNALVTNDAIVGGVDLRIAGLVDFGNEWTDPSGNRFYGTEIQLKILDFYEV